MTEGNFFLCYALGILGGLIFGLLIFNKEIRSRVTARRFSLRFSVCVAYSFAMNLIVVGLPAEFGTYIVVAMLSLILNAIFVAITIFVGFVIALIIGVSSRIIARNRRISIIA